MKLRISRKIFILVLVGITLLLVLLSAGAQVIKIRSGQNSFIVRLFDLDQEMNIPTFFQMFSLLCIGITLFFIGLLEKCAETPKARYWWILTSAFFFVAVDEMVGFHEVFIWQVKNLVHVSGFLNNAWVIPWGIVIVFFAWYLRRFFRLLDRKTRCQFYLAAGVYLLGAIGMEMVGGKVFDLFGVGDFHYIIATHIEESLEMTGIIIFEFSLLDYLKMHPMSLDIDVV